MKAEIDKRNALLSSCDSNDDCEAEFICDNLLKSKCRKLTCDESSGLLSSAQCNGVCTPNRRRILSANFTDSGRSIVAELNFPAKNTRFLCSEVFDKDSVVRLGDECRGAAKGTRMLLKLSHGGTLMPADVLIMRDDQDTIRDVVSGVRFSSRDNEGDLVPTAVGGCVGQCDPPSTLVVYPSMISAPCSASDAARVILDGTYSRDRSGRTLNCTWSFDAQACQSMNLACSVLEEKVANKAIR